MNKEDPKFNPHGLFVVKKENLQNTETSLELPTESIEEVPLSFFIAYRNGNGIISNISFSPEFSVLVNQQISSNTIDDFESNAKTIKQITGFSVESLNAKLLQLQNKYEGKKETPPFTTKDTDNLLSF